MMNSTIPTKYEESDRNLKCLGLKLVISVSEENYNTLLQKQITESMY